MKTSSALSAVLSRPTALDARQGTPALGSARSFARPDRFAILHLVLLSCVLTAAVLAEAGMVPSVWLACQAAIGLLAATWAFSLRRSRDAALVSRVLAFALAALPCYAVAQSVPLPLGLVSLLSPTKAQLHESVLVLAPHIPRWTPLSVDPEATIAFAARLAAYACLYWIARSLSCRLGPNRAAAAWPIVAVALMESTIALLQDARGEPATGSYVNRNHLAGLLAMALPFATVPAFSIVPAVSAWTRPRPRPWLGNAEGKCNAGWSFFAVCCAACMFAGILASKSRAGLAASLVSLLVVGLLALRRLRGAKQWAAALVLLTALLAAVLVYLPSETLVRRYAALAGRDGLLREGRVLLWKETLDLVAAYPIAGCGFGAYQTAFLRYKQSAPMVTDRHAHNDYLEILAESGAIGLALCAMLAAVPITAALRATRRADAREAALALACVGSLTAILVHGLVDFNLRIPANAMVLFWVLGLCAAGNRPRKAP